MSKKVLYITIIISALSAVISDQIGNGLYFIFKPITTALVILLTFIHGDRTNQKYFNRIFWGLVFCLIGDVILLDPDLFVWGLAAFLTALILFSEAFRSFEGVPKNVSVLAILGVIGVAIFMYLFDSLDEFIVPAAVFILALVFMAWTGINLHLSGVYPHSQLLPLAVTLLIISEALIAMERFKFNSQEFVLLGVPILLTYWASVTLISNSLTKSS